MTFNDLKGHFNHFSVQYFIENHLVKVNRPQSPMLLFEKTTTTTTSCYITIFTKNILSKNKLGWVLIRGWALIKFSPFSTSVVCIFCNKMVNGNNKTRRCNKATFLQNSQKKTPSSGKSLVTTYSFLGGWALI